MSYRTHTFCHKNIVRGSSQWEDKTGCRPFNTVKEHDECILGNINNLVEEDDVLIHLGDFAFGGKDNVTKFMDRINCKNVLITFGNHDGFRLTSIKNRFLWYGDYLEFKYKGNFFVANHYPIGSWNNMSKGSIHLFGHVHGNYKNHGRSIDCCPEENDYKPILLDDVIKRFQNVEPSTVDHHTPKDRTHY